MKTSKIVIKNLFGIRETTLDGKSVEISGPKGAGKTSVLDAIRFALTNRSERDCIVHQGADEGEIIIETTTGLSIDRKALPAKSAGTVKVRDGSLLQTRPAEFLSQIFTPLQLNPVEFTQLSRQEKNRVILSLIEFDWDVNWIREQFGEIPQGVDYSKHILEVLNDIQAENGVYFQSRQNINRDIRNKQAFISDIAKDIPSGYDYDRWNQYPIGDRYRELERLREKNSVIERAKAFRANFTSKLRGLEGSRDVEIGAIDRDIAAERAALTGSIERMKAELQATMGLPELTFSLKKAADNVATRVSSGIVAMILRDAKANGLHTINRESDIPSELGAANIAAIKRAMLGYITKPTTLYVSVIGADADIKTGFQALAVHSYDYLVGPVDIASADATALAAQVKAQRTKRYVGKVILPNVAADDEGVINFVSSGIKVGEGTFTAAQYAGRIAGVLAGTPAYCSATYAALPEVTGVDTLTDPDSAVDAGKLFLIDDGRQVKLSRAVTSKTTLAEDDPDMLKKIKLVAALDLIRYYAITTVEDEYLGKCANTYDNKCILLVAFSDFFASLEAQNVIQEGSSGAELDANAIRTYLLGIAEEAGDTEEIARIKALTDEALRKEDTGSHVFLYLYGHVLDAMEDFHITLEAQ